jgi:hypothetical protein
MFDDWKHAWRQAVENFHREAGVEGAPPRVRAMERELTSVGGALLKLDDEIRRTSRELDREREAELVCRRRETLARDVGDEETVAVAVEFAARHAERAAVLERKHAVLLDERTLLARDVAEMKKTLADVAASAPTSSASLGTSGGEARETRDDAGDVEFSRLERERRERAADDRLEELKRKMRG